MRRGKWGGRNGPPTIRFKSGGSALDLYFEALVDKRLEEGAHLVGRDLGQVLRRRRPVDGVGHHLARVEGADDVEHGADHLVVGRVETLVGGDILIGRRDLTEEAPLEDEIAVELFERLDDPCYVVARCRVVDASDKFVGRCVDFHDGVVDLAKGVEDLGDVDARGVAEDGNLGRGGKLVAERQGEVDDLGELRVERRFAVAGEGDGVDFYAVGVEVLEFVGEVVAYLFGRGELGVVAAVAVPAAFAVDAVEVAYFSFFREEVDAERGAESTAIDGSKNCFFA